MIKTRRVEVFKKNKWSEIEFTELKVGDIFRMFEPTGEFVTGIEGETEWICTSDPFYINGVLAVNAEPMKKK